MFGSTNLNEHMRGASQPTHGSDWPMGISRSWPAMVTEGLRRPYTCAELALGYGRAGGDKPATRKKSSSWNFLMQQTFLRTQCRITAAKSVGFVSNREERIELK